MTTLMMICTIISIISFIFSMFALALGTYAAVIVIALRNSTHKIEWRPIEDPFKNTEEDEEDLMDEERI